MSSRLTSSSCTSCTSCSSSRPRPLAARPHAARQRAPPIAAAAAARQPSCAALPALPKGQRRRSRVACSSRRAAVAASGIGLAIAAGGALAAAGVAAAASGRLGSSSDPQALIREGMRKFRAGDVEGSLADFDAALAAAPKLRPLLWQRGLSLYYLEQFEAGAQQFRDDVQANPQDTEEAVWALLCEARLVGPARAREQMLVVGRDPRPVMRAADAAFRSPDGRPEAILEAAGPLDAEGHAAFYAQLYAGLWHEAHGEPDAARDSITRAVATRYARASNDYMADVARVHCLRRGWPLPA